MSKELLSSFPLVLIFLHFTITCAQSPAQAPAQAPPPPTVPSPAQAPPPPTTGPPPRPLVSAPPTGPANLYAILQKAKRFATFIQLLKITQVGDQINVQLNKNQRLTIFAPADDAFGGLKLGTLNSLTDQQQSLLMQFHVLTSFFSIAQFQTVTNPLGTEAGTGGRFPLNVTTSGNSVNITTGIVNATVTGTVYSDNQLAVYQVDKVLLAYDIFGPSAPAAAPAPSKPKKKAPISSESDAPSGSSVDASVVPSGAIGLIHHALNAVFFIVSVIAVFSL